MLDVESDEGRRAVRRLVGVYDASGTVWGEVSYWLRARLGGDHCALCDITHGRLREKQEWRDCRAALPVPLETVHLDERDEALARATEGRAPCVVAVTDEGPEVLVDADRLAACQGSPRALVDAIVAAAEQRALDLG